jgi:hypothetical protein
MRSLTSILLITAITLFGCEDTGPTTNYPFSFTAYADGQPLSDVQILAAGDPLGNTDSEGNLLVTLTGPEGASVPLSVRCPEGYRSPAGQRPLRLQRFTSLTQGAAENAISRRIDCPPAERNAAIILRASGMADLPITIRGREVARTDASGVAHFSMRMAPNGQIRLIIDTASRPEIRPQNPEATLRMPDRDEIFIVDQTLEVAEEPRRRRRRSRPTAGPSLPTRL